MGSFLPEERRHISHNLSNDFNFLIWSLDLLVEKPSVQKRKQLNLVQEMIAKCATN